MPEGSEKKRAELLKLCLEELESCLDYTHRYSKKKEQHFEIVRNIAKEYSEIEIEHERAKSALEATEQYFDNQENDCTEDVQQVYNKYLEEQPTISSYESHPIWHKINNSIDSYNKGGKASIIDSDISFIEDDNESIVEGIIPSPFVPPVDPMTKKIIEDPCKNKICGHVYEYTTIMEHLKNTKQKKSKTRCMHIGCTNANMRTSVIIKDNALKQKIKIYLENKQDESLDQSQNNSSVLQEDSIL